MNKKGAELPLNTLIVVILVVIVLIVVSVFFLGGTSSLSRSIRNIFYGTTAGTDVNLAVEICRNRCQDALALPTSPESIRKNSAYCKSPFELDLDNDGKAELEDPSDPNPATKKFKCNDPEIGVSCSGITC